MPGFKIAIIGDFFDDTEATYRTPFVGRGANQLSSILADAGIEKSKCYFANVFNLRPDRDDVDSFCTTKASGRGIRGRSPISSGRYLDTAYAGELDRLLADLEQVRPNVTILLGNIPCWALLDRQNISKIRGTVTESAFIPGLKCLPTYDLSAVTRQYDLRHVAVLDFIKARVESAFPEIRTPKVEVWLEPSLDDLDTFKREYIDNASFLAFDIETGQDQITCVGFSPSIHHSIVVPFVDPRRGGANFWATPQEEARAWQWIADVLDSAIPKVGQNGLYDIQWLWARMGIPVRNYAHDTMLLHHALYPEASKSLDFLGSIYTNHSAWKAERAKTSKGAKKEE